MKRIAKAAVLAIAVVVVGVSGGLAVAKVITTPSTIAVEEVPGAEVTIEDLQGWADEVVSGTSVSVSPDNPHLGGWTNRGSSDIYVSDWSLADPEWSRLVVYHEALHVLQWRSGLYDDYSSDDDMEAAVYCASDLLTGTDDTCFDLARELAEELLAHIN